MPPYNIPHTGTPWYSNYGNLDSATVIGFSMLYNRENAIIESVVVKDNISQVANNGGITVISDGLVHQDLYVTMPTLGVL